MACTSAGDWSTNRSLCNTSSTAWRSVVPNARGDGARGRVGGGEWRGAPTSIERRPRHPDALTQRRRLAWRRDGLDGTHQSVSSSSWGVRGIPRISATFFWRVMIVSARCKLPLEPAVLRLELLHAWVDRARRWSPAAPAHLPQGARLALPPPVRQQRRVQALAAQQRAHLTGLPAGIRFLEDAEPILRGEAPPLGLGRHFRIGFGRA